MTTSEVMTMCDRIDQLNDEAKKAEREAKRSG